MANNRIRINYKENLDRIDLTSGQFKLLFNIYQNVLGSNIGGRIYITEISPSRTEIKVKLVDDTNTIQWDSFSQITDQTEKVGNYVANFGNNNTILITNWIYDNNGDLIFKLYEPLFDEFETKSQLWISKLIAEQIKDTVIVSEPAEEEAYNTLSAPNFNIPITNVTENDTGFQTWNDVLSTNTDTSNNLIDKYFSQSFFDSAELNIDYSDYNNFVHFGSAQEKLDNFVYKLGLIEIYDSRSAILTNLSSSTAITSEISQTELSKRKVINGFDGYERYLYYESSSNYTIDREYNLSSSVDNYYATTWPKTGSWHSQTLLPSTSSAGIEWYQSQSVRATEFDNLNLHRLINTVPNYIKYDTYNDEYLLFVNMIGHFFDNIWTYINAFNDLYTRENDISLGLSKDLIYDSLEALGVKLNNGNNLIDLWKYEFGYDSTGSYLNTGDQFKSIANKNITTEIWNRILNNLPYLLKTKGTKRGIQALVTCYGIPSSILDIYEYGGPSETGSDWNTEGHIQQFIYSLPISGSEYVTGSWPGSIAATEIRVNFTDTSANKEETQSIFKVGNTELYVSKSDTANYGTIILNDADGNTVTSSELRLFDGDFWNIMIASGSDNELYIKKYKDGEKIYSDSANFPEVVDVWNLDNGSGFSTGWSWTNAWLSSQLINSGASIRVIWKSDTALSSWDQRYISYAGKQTLAGVNYRLKIVVKANGNMIGADRLRIKIDNLSNPWLSLPIVTTANFAEVIVDFNSYIDYNIRFLSTTMATTNDWYEIQSIEVLDLDAGTTYIQYPANAQFSFSDFESTGSFIIGSGLFEGDVQEARFWDVAPTEYDLIEHARSPKSIRITNGNPYDNLITRYAFDRPANLALSTSIADTSPNPANRTSSLASGFSSATTYPYNYNASSSMATPLMPSIGYNIASNKTRVENNYLLTSMSLQPDVRSEVRAYDYAPIDSPRVGVFFSLTNLINERIIEVYSNTNYDDYIGDPADKFKNYYPKLREVNEEFWSKYAPTMSFNDYLSYVKHYDMSLFDTIRNNLPARAQKQVGVVIEPHILQRSRVPIIQEPSWEDLYKSASVTVAHTELLDGDLASYMTMVSGSEFDATVDSEMLSYNTLVVGDQVQSSIEGGFLTYYCISGSKTFTAEMPDIYISFSSTDVPTGSLMMPPMIYPKCNFMTSSGYAPYSSSDSSSLFYSPDNYVLNSDKSLGFLRSRYIGCLQTEDTTIDGKIPVEIAISSDNKLITQDGGDINLIVR